MQNFSVFNGDSRVGQGDAGVISEHLQAMLNADPQLAGVLVFEDQTGLRVDVDLRVGAITVAAPAAEQVAPTQGGGTRRGRPRLGVVGREVTLLPRHWQWLAAQPGGSSAALRRLIDTARKTSKAGDEVRAAQEAAYRFMTAMAGDRAGFEEAMRALYAGSAADFAQHSANWPADIRAYAKQLARPALH